MRHVRVEQLFVVLVNRFMELVLLLDELLDLVQLRRVHDFLVFLLAVFQKPFTLERALLERAVKAVVEDVHVVAQPVQHEFI